MALSYLFQDASCYQTHALTEVPRVNGSLGIIPRYNTLTLFLMG